VRVFIAHGDRTDRTKARMKYVLDAWGFEKYLTAVEEKLGRPLTRVAEEAIAPRAPFDRAAHIGVHPQRQDGLNWIGVALPVGKMTTEQMCGLAAIARDFGDGDIRLTVWQNLLISGVRDDRVDEAKAAIEGLGLDWKASSLRAGLVACTGATGCKFAAAHTKEHAVEIADYVDARLLLDAPVNVHLTGCHHSCAQHYIGDIGLMGVKVTTNDEGDQVEGYTIVVGGGFGDQAKIGREVWREVPADECAAKVEGLLRAYLDHRRGPGESFQAFSARHEPDELKALCGAMATA
jgi:ferredoxin-nitrite reductase